MSALKKERSPEHTFPRGNLSDMTLTDYLRHNIDFIRQCHEENMQAVDIMTALSVTVSKTKAYKTFSAVKLGRSHMGFDPIVEVRRREREAKIAGFAARVIPQDGATGIIHVENNRDLIIELQQGNFYGDEIANILDLPRQSLNYYLVKAEVSRLALGLPPLKARSRNIQRYRPAFEREWSAQDELHIRRGHACGFLMSAVGAQCSRSGLEIKNKAKEMGLGPWTVELDPRKRQVLARDYDAHDQDVRADLSRPGDEEE